MRNRFALAFTACALASAALLSPVNAIAAEVAPAGGAAVGHAADRVDSAQVWLDCQGGMVTLRWQNDVVGYWDYVALFDQNPHSVGPKGYLAGEWQWASRGNSFQTSRQQGLYWVAYISWDYGTGYYKIVTVEGPKFMNC